MQGKRLSGPGPGAFLNINLSDIINVSNVACISNKGEFFLQNSHNWNLA